MSTFPGTSYRLGRDVTFELSFVAYYTKTRHIVYARGYSGSRRIATVVSEGLRSACSLGNPMLGALFSFFKGGIRNNIPR